MKQTIDVKKKLAYWWVTLYEADTPTQPTLQTFNDFKEATEYIKEHKYIIVYLEDQKEQGGQRWGLRHIHKK